MTRAFFAVLAVIAGGLAGAPAGANDAPPDAASVAAPAVAVASPVPVTATAPPTPDRPAAPEASALPSVQPPAAADAAEPSVTASVPAGSPAPLSPLAPADDPVRLARTLQALQNRMAEGDAAAARGQAELIRLIAERMGNVPSATWRDARNVRAATLYLLIGGSPAVAPMILAAPELAPDAAPLLKAAVATALGRARDAATLWEAIDPRTLPPSLAGPAALVKANGLLESDPGAALALLGLARLAAPGSLVEEAALRRSVAAAARIGDAAAFTKLSLTYVRRFPRSLYAPAFRRTLAQSFLKLPGSHEPAALKDLGAMLDGMTPGERLRTALEIGRLALVAGRTSVVAFAADAARSVADAGRADQARATLYAAAAEALDPAVGGNAEAIRGIAPGSLNRADAALRAAALEVMESVERWPDLAAARAPEGVEPSPEQTALAGQVATATVAADDLLKRLDP